MNSLGVLILTVLLSKGVDCASISDQDYEMADKLFTLGAEAFLKYLDNLKMPAEFIVKKNNIKKTGNDMQDFWTSLKEMIKRISAVEKAKGHDDFIVAVKICKKLFDLLEDGLRQMRRAYSSGPFRELEVFKGILKKKTIEDLWKYVESQYLPGAPPIYSNPVGFCSHLLSKILAQPRVIEILKIAVEYGKMDINKLFDEAKLAAELFSEKVREISTSEQQKETDEFLITLRTASQLLVYYWDKVLEYTESQAFNNEYLDALGKWNELRALKNTEKYHVMFDPQTGHNAWTWADQRFSDFYDNAALEYNQWGTGIFGDDRFKQSNWAIRKMATVYPLPLYERLSQYGLGMSEVNDFLIDTDETLTELIGEDIVYNLRRVVHELWNYICNEILHISINKKSQLTSDLQYEDQYQHLRKIKATCFDIWDRVIFEINKNVNDDGLKQSASHWDEVKRVFIKELTDSGQITQKNLDEAQKTINSIKQLIIDKYVKMVDGLEERISKSAEILDKVMLKTFSATNTLLVNFLAFLTSD